MTNDAFMRDLSRVEVLLYELIKAGWEEGEIPASVHRSLRTAHTEIANSCRYLDELDEVKA